MAGNNLCCWLLVCVLLWLFMGIQQNESRLINGGKGRERLKTRKLRRGNRNRNGNLNMREFKRLNSRQRRTKEGKLRYKKKQFYKNIPVFGATAVVERDNDGVEIPILGKYYMEQDIKKYITNIKPSISKQIAKRIALSSIENGGSDINNAYKAELYIYHHRNKPHLSWFVDIPTKVVIIDANNGRILAKHDKLINFEACGDGGNEKIGKYSYCSNEKPALQIDSTRDLDGSYILANSRIEIYDNLDYPNYDFSKAEKIKCDPINYGNQCKIDDVEVNGAYCLACDVFYQLNIVFNIYDEWLKDPYVINEEHLPLHAYVHVTDEAGEPYDNAAFGSDNNGRGIMIFGDGDYFYPFAALDISAHELAHGFTRNNSELVYADESGAMDEAYSDLMAQVAKYYVNKDDVDWAIGCDITKTNGCVRYMDDRAVTDNFKDGYYPTMNVHDSSGIFNKAWWLLNTEYDWDMKTLFEVVSKAHSYWQPDSTFNDGLCGIYEALYEIKGDSNITDIMADDLVDAFEEVGVQCIQYIEQDDDIIITDSDIIQIGEEPIIINGDKTEWIYFTLNTQDLVLSDDSLEELLTISISGGIGDADLYILINDEIWSTNFFCVSNSIGNDEECIIQIDKSIDCNIYILLYGWNSFEGATLNYKITPYHPTKLIFDETIDISGDSTTTNYYYFELTEESKVTLMQLSEWDTPIIITVKGSKSETIAERLTIGMYYVELESLQSGIYYVLIQSRSTYSNVKLSLSSAATLDF